MIDPSRPLSIAEALIFGANARRHPVLGFCLEQGSGANPPDVQAELYIRGVERDDGPEAGAALRAKLRAAAAANPLHVVEVPAAKAEAELATVKDEKAQEVPGPLLSTAVH